MTVLVINAGLSGSQGNCQVAARHCCDVLTSRGVPWELLVLRDVSTRDVEAALARAQRLVFVTGTYWGGFSSLLQRLFEDLTSSEGSTLWLGKPVAAVVTAHQVGAQTVLWRLQGMVAALGCLVPPMSGVVVTKVAEQLRKRAPEVCADVWGWEDVTTAMHNLLAAPILPLGYAAWPVDREHFTDLWLEPESPVPTEAQPPVVAPMLAETVIGVTTTAMPSAS